jgi:hypothetical protein
MMIGIMCYLVSTHLPCIASFAVSVASTLYCRGLFRMNGVKDMLENRFGPVPAPSDPEGYSLWLCGSSPIKENREKLRLLASTDTVERFKTALRGFEALAVSRGNRERARQNANAARARAEGSGHSGHGDDPHEDEDSEKEEEEEDENDGEEEGGGEDMDAEDYDDDDDGGDGHFDDADEDADEDAEDVAVGAAGSGQGGDAAEGSSASTRRV